MTSIYNSTTTTLLVDTTSTRKIVFLPVASTVGAGRLLWIKDISGNAATNAIYISTIGMDRIENRFMPSTLFAVVSSSYGSVLMTTDGILNWYFLQHYYRNAISVGVLPGSISATGGTIVTSGFKYHVFTSTSNFVVSSATGTVNYLVVGGGGGGGDRHGGGGGAGGVLTGTWSVSAGTYTVTVGLGGTGGYYETNNSSPQGAGIKGGNSSLSGTGVSVTANGGGGGGTYDGNPTGTVGSGGGGGGNNLAGVAGTAGQGNSGGSGAGPGGGGGGGAGGVGANANTSTGGIGTTSYSTHLIAVGYGTTFAVPTSPNAVISGGVAYIAAGGGGAAGSGPGPGGSGGLGGGGRGDWNNSFITAATNNTGSGGGGARSEDGSSRGFDGGSGLILLWYDLEVVSGRTYTFTGYTDSPGNPISYINSSSVTNGALTFSGSAGASETNVFYSYTNDIAAPVAKGVTKNSSRDTINLPANTTGTQTTFLSYGPYNTSYTLAGSMPTGFSASAHTVIIIMYHLGTTGALGGSSGQGNNNSVASGGIMYQMGRSSIAGNFAINGQLIVGENGAWDYNGNYSMSINATTVNIQSKVGWVMVAFVWRAGNTCAYYYNGSTAMSSGGGNGASAVAGTIYIGVDQRATYYNGVPGSCLNAEIAFYGLWNSALTAAQIGAFYTQHSAQFSGGFV